MLPVSVVSVPQNIPDYDRDEWRHWTDEDRDCQNARQEVLIAESHVPVSFQTDEKCRVATGSWTGPYTGQQVDDPRDLDVDHVVPLANAHRSGGWSWDRDRKRDYANSLAYDNHLVATISSANRAKGSKGPDDWRPPLEDYWCNYAIDWATIKNQWGLTVTEAEYAALAEMLATCETTVLLQPTTGAVPQAPTPTIPPDLPTDLRYDPFGPDRDCGDFDSYQEALAFYLAAGGPDEDPHRLDSNGDGEPCETLPGGPSAQVSPPSSDDGSVRLTLYAHSGSQELDLCVNPPGTAARYVPSTLISAPANQDCLPLLELPSQQSNSHSPSVPGPAYQSTPVPALASANEPAATPVITPATAPLFTDHDCSNFLVWRGAQDFYEAQGGPEDDPHGLDKDGDGVACQSLPGAPEVPGATSATLAPEPAESTQTVPTPAYIELPFSPAGPDRDCAEFSSWWDAQNFYLAAGGPWIDPHGLDRNGDGIACESLPGAPIDDSEPPPIEADASSGTPDFVDHNCSDFTTYNDAQDFYLSQGGPESDPHRLDRNGDGVACESLPGSPGEDPEPPSIDADTSPETPAFVDRNCSDFTTWKDAQDFYLSQGGPESDPHRLDRNGDGVACESLPGSPSEDPEQPSIDADTSPETPAFVDRNCSDFTTWKDAQDFYLSQGGPESDPHRLDRNGDGNACESLPGAPKDDTA